jgi:hypothetical protein
MRHKVVKKLNSVVEELIMSRQCCTLVVSPKSKYAAEEITSAEEVKISNLIPSS